jgi:hypothetical protein
MSFFAEGFAMRKFTVLAVLMVSLLAQVPAAEARYGHHHNGGGAVIAGILGLGLGLALAPRTYHESETVIVEHEYQRAPRHYYHRRYQRHYDDDDRYYERDRYYDD